MAKTAPDPVEIARSRRRLPPPEMRRAIRTAAGLSQHQLARELGVTSSAVALWERGQRVPRPAHLVAYVSLLHRLQRDG